MNDSRELEVLVAPRYSFSEADYLAGVTRGTGRRWLTGYAYRGTDSRLVKQPPVTPGLDRPEAVSFLDLVELVAIGRLKKFSFSLIAIRNIVKNCQELLAVERPLVSLEFKTDGREVFVERDELLLEVGAKEGNAGLERGS